MFSDIRLRIFNKDKMILYTLSLVLFVLHIWYINGLYLPNILDDEFGYWGIAAYFAGIDWSSATSHISYYSYGYSILLTPLFWLFDDPVVIYRAALVINSVLLSLIPTISLSISKKIFPKTNKWFLLIVSFSVSLYPSYIVYSNIAWSESLLIFVCWMIVWCFFYLNRNSPTWIFFLTAFFLVYAYSIHQRTIGILIAGVITIILMKTKKNINSKQLLSFILSLGILLIIHTLIKDHITTNLWYNSENIGTNDYSGQLSKLKELFTIDGLFRAFYIMCGQLFYIGTSSYLMGYFGIFCIISILRELNKIRIMSENNTVRSINNVSFPLIFLIFGFIMSYAISVIFMINANRIDHILYGRYNDMIIGPIILIGIISTVEYYKRIFLPAAISISLLVLTGIISAFGINKLNSQLFNGITVIGIKQYYINGIFNFKIAMGITVVIVLLYIFLSKIKHKMPIAPLLVLVFGSIFFISGMRINKNDLLPSHNMNYKVNTIIDYVNNNPKPIYFLIENDFNIDRKKDFIQFLLLNRQLICVTEEELAEVRGDKYVVTGNSNPLTYGLQNEYSLVYAVNSNYLWESQYNSEQKRLILPLSLFHTINGLSNGKDTIRTSFESDGTANYLMYGPYMSLNKGNFRTSVELELIGAKQDVVGYIDVVSGGVSFGKEEVLKSNFENSLLELELPFSLQEQTNNIEIRFFTNEGTLLRIKSVYLFND